MRYLDRRSSEFSILIISPTYVPNANAVAIAAAVVRRRQVMEFYREFATDVYIFAVRISRSLFTIVGNRECLDYRAILNNINPERKCVVGIWLAIVERKCSATVGDGWRHD